MLEIGKHTIHIWMADFNVFHQEFCEFLLEYTKIAELKANVNKQKLEMVHTQWVGDCEHFRVYLFEKEAKELSHIKLMGLLVGCMAHSNIFDKIEVLDDCSEDEHLKRERADLMGAPESVVVFDFALTIINWFEKYRTDKRTPHVYRLTPSVRHDMIRFIRSPDPARADKTSIILLFDALYSRT
jgi:hypothetical protein